MSEDERSDAETTERGAEALTSLREAVERAARAAPEVRSSLDAELAAALDRVDAAGPRATRELASVGVAALAAGLVDVAARVDACLARSPERLASAADATLLHELVEARGSVRAELLAVLATGLATGDDEVVRAYREREGARLRISIENLRRLAPQTWLRFGALLPLDPPAIAVRPKKRPWWLLIVFGAGLRLVRALADRHPAPDAPSEVAAPEPRRPRRMAPDEAERVLCEPGPTRLCEVATHVALVVPAARAASCAETSSDAAMLRTLEGETARLRAAATALAAAFDEACDE